MAGKGTITVKVKGVPQTVARLRLLNANVQRRVFRGALNETAQKGVQLARGYLKTRRSGLLKRAIAFKSNQKGKNFGYRVIGADRGFKTVVPGSNRWDQVTLNAKRGVTVVLTGKGKRNSKPRTAKISAKGLNVTSGLALNPSKYAHLVEGGRKANRPVNAKAMRFRITNKKGSSATQIWSQYVRRVASAPFMRPASERLAFMYPWIMEQHLRKVA